jgi:hypothetical protein
MGKPGTDKHKQGDGKTGNGLGVHDPRKCRATNWIILDMFNRGHDVRRPAFKQRKDIDGNY